MRSRTAERWGTALVAVATAVAWLTPAGATEISDRPRPSASFDDSVYAVAYRADVVFVGGRFKAAYDNGATAERSRLAAVDADTGRLLDWAPRVDGEVQAIAVHGDSVYLAGDFGYVDGERRRGLAKLDAATGDLDPDFAPEVQGRALALAVGHDRLYVGGSLTAIDGQPRDHVAAVALDSGAVDPEWTPSADRNVYAIAVDTSRVYLGGVFSQLNGLGEHRKLAAVDPATGATDTGFRPGVSVIVRDLTLGPDGLYAAIGGVGGRLIGFHGDGTRQWVVAANGDFQALALLGDVLYAGGHFNQICRGTRTDPDGTCLGGSSTRRKLAAVDLAGTLLAWAPHADSAAGVQAMAVDPSRSAVAVGGAFTSFGEGSVEQRHFARFG